MLRELECRECGDCSSAQGMQGEGVSRHCLFHLIRLCAQKLMRGLLIGLSLEWEGIPSGFLSSGF